MAKRSDHIHQISSGIYSIGKEKKALHRTKARPREKGSRFEQGKYPIRKTNSKKNGKTDTDLKARVSTKKKRIQ